MPTDPLALEHTAARRQGLSVGLATGIYGISFGALGIAAGLDLWQTVALSLLLFTGGSQFAFIGIISAGGNPVTAVVTSTLLGIRNGLYGLQLARVLRLTGWRRAAAAHLTIDESTAVALAQEDPAVQRTGFWAGGLGVFTFWNLSTLIGAVVGNAIGDPRVWGLDAAAAAAFVALIWPRLRDRTGQVTAALAAAIALIAFAPTPAGIPVLLAALAAVVIGLISSAPSRARDLEQPEGDLL
ncbi:branched-chain amino acid ABC transporter permease [Janibacter sp. Soil728]|uniref:AzlC family ABC transporter permease n=1 Tax=Janibacter sp. Soil728 TaxID=1736393 RepID=UPI0006F90861|nr:AzlC family ABC transporter permease [Janibacter sp. Soil728]KRE37866.1 branched-chain amino acid ABC transporter permease [Janibacter sp. Soil728]